MKHWFIIVLLFSWILAAEAQNGSGWQTAKVVSFDSREWSVQSSSGEGRQTRLTCRLVLNGGSITYVLQRDSPREKPPKFTVDSTAKYVFDHDDIIVRDESGREFRMRVIKQGTGSEVQSTQANADGTTPTAIPAKDDQVLLQVTSNVDGAEIYLDNKLVGHTPCRITVPKGNYLLSVRQQDYLGWQRNVMVLDNKVSFYAELTPQDVVLSEPRGGSVADAARATRKQQ